MQIFQKLLFTVGLSIDDYYLSNPIARASAIMASLSAMRADAEKATGTDG